MTAETYNQELKRLQAEWPKYPLLRILRQGYSVQNMHILIRALSKLKEKPTPLNDAEATNIDQQDDDPKDETLRMMRVHLRKLFINRAELSDKFHNLHTPDDRLKNSEEIQMLQREIEAMMTKIRHYKIHGELPEGQKPGKFYIPTDPASLIIKHKQLQKLIVDKRMQINKMKQNGDLNDPRSARLLEGWINRLEELIKHKQYVEQEIERLYPKGFPGIRQARKNPNVYHGAGEV